MVDIANLRIVVDLDPAGVARGALASTAAINGFVRSTQAGLTRLGSAFTGLTAGQRAFAGTATVATLVGTALVSVARQAIEFESAFAGVEKTVSGTPAQLASIRDGLIDLSTVLPTSANELAGIAESAGQLGVQAPNVLQFTEVVAKLGETTDLSFDGAATSLARFLNITDGGVQNIEDAANVLVDLGNNSATTESQILNFSQRLAGAFTTAGATQEEIQAVAATFSSLGIEAEAGGSALSRVITQISDAALTGSDDLTTFAMVAGMTEAAFAALATDDPVEAFRQFELGLRDIIDSGGSITPILNQLGLDGLRVADALRRGALGADILTSSLNRADSALAEGTALNTEYANRVETTAAQLAILRDRLTAVAITAGTPLLGTLSDGAQLAGDAIERLVDLIAPLAGTLGNTFGNLASAAGTFFDVLGSPVLQASVGILNGVATALNLVLTAFNALGPAGAVLALIAADLILVGPLSITAATGVAALSASLASVGVSGTIAAAGARAFQAAVAVGPYILVAAAIAAVGGAFLDAQGNAQALADTLNTELDVALETGDYEAATQASAALADEYQRASDIVGGSTAFEIAGLRVRDFSGIVSALGGFLPGVGSAVLDAEATVDALGGTVLRVGGEVSTVEEIFGIFGDAVGLSGAQAFAVAEQLGLVEQVIGGTSAGFRDAVIAVNNYADANSIIAEQLGLTGTQLLQSALSAGELSAALNLTTDEIAFLANGIDDVDFADLFSDDPETRINALDAILGELNGRFGELAAISGVAAEALVGQAAAAEALIGANNALRESIQNLVSSYAGLTDPVAEAAAAQVRFAEALSGNDLDAARVAALEYFGAFASSGVSFDVAIAKQAEIVQQLFDFAIASGASTQEAITFAAAVGAIPEQTVAELILDGSQYIAELDEAELRTLRLQQLDTTVVIMADGGEVETTLRDLEGFVSSFVSGDYSASIGADGSEASAVIGETTAEAEAYAQAYEAQILANGGLAEAEIAARENQANVYARAYDAIITASGGQAEGEISARENQANVYARAYDATITASGGQAQGEISARENQANVYARAYNATITATGGQAQGEISAREGQAGRYARTYNATLTARDNASSVIRRAIGALTGFRSRTITLTTRRVTQLVGGPREHGGDQFLRGWDRVVSSGRRHRLCRPSRARCRSGAGRHLHRGHPLPVLRRAANELGVVHPRRRRPAPQPPHLGKDRPDVGAHGPRWDRQGIPDRRPRRQHVDHQPERRSDHRRFQPGRRRRRGHRFECVGYRHWPGGCYTGPG